MKSVSSFTVTCVASAWTLCGCSLADAMHTAQVYNDLNSQAVLSAAPTNPGVIGIHTGQAFYSGLGAVAASDGKSATAFLGDATIRVDFDTSTLSGQISMYSAKGGLDPTTDPTKFFDMVEKNPAKFLLSMGPASGTVTLSQGSVSGADFSVSASSGTLIYDGTAVVVTGGAVSGTFTGQDAGGIITVDSAITGAVNGLAADQMALYFAAATN